MSLRNFSVGCLLALLAFALGGCALGVSSAVPPVGQAAPATQARFPLTLQDDLGRSVTLAARPQRVVSLAPSNTEVLFAVGAGPQVVGITKYCNFPPEAARGREVVGGFSAKSLSVEKIVSLQPDLVIASGSLHQTVIEALEQAKLPVLAIEAGNMEGIYRDLLLVGQATGNTPQAEQVVASSRGRMAALAEKVRSIPPETRLKVFYELWDEPLTTAGPGSFIGQMIEAGGGVNIFAEVKELYPEVSIESVVSRSPDLILGPSSHADKLTAEIIRARPGWGNIQAVRTGRIEIIDGDIASRAGPRVVDGAEQIARALYPERFK